MYNISTRYQVQNTFFIINCIVHLPIPAPLAPFPAKIAAFPAATPPIIERKILTKELIYLNLS